MALDLWLPLDEAAGPTAVDLSGNGRNGTYSGTVTYGVPTTTSGVNVPGGMTELGIVTLPYGAELVLSTLASTTWSVGAVVKSTTTAAYPQVIVKGDSATAGWELFLSDQYNTIGFKINGQQSAVAGYTTADENLVAAVWDGAKMAFYVKGALLATDATVLGQADGTTGDVLVGNATSIDLGQLVISTVAWSAADVAGMYDSWTGANILPYFVS